MAIVYRWMVGSAAEARRHEGTQGDDPEVIVRVTPRNGSDDGANRSCV
ncbi:MAG: hypothetical protein GF363_14575 [Chitinivibrionales bacterium]|nr:hypothetical protein [Chitinivibrionales bacterium]